MGFVSMKGGGHLARSIRFVAIWKDLPFVSSLG